MDWTNERYVRLYVRDTVSWTLLPWEARALFCELLRKCDRAGVVECKHGHRGIAALTRIPEAVVEDALDALLADGCVTKCDAGYLMPNFLEAQEAPQSDAQRSRASRERRRDLARHGGAVTERDTPTQNVSEPSRPVTSGHVVSHGVTPAFLPSSNTPPQVANGAPDPVAAFLAAVATEVRRGAWSTTIAG